MVDVKKRRYEMQVRGEAVSATRDAIVAAVIDCVVEQRSLGVTLASVADRAGVTVKTVLRHFGNRDTLLDVAWSNVNHDVAAEREVQSGDPAAALTVLIEHYERRGDMVIGLLAEEDDDPRARRVCDSGRQAHRGWVERAFADQLPTRAVERARLIDALVVVTDVYCWKLLRRDRGLSDDDVLDRMLLMTHCLLGEGVRP